MLSAGHYFRPYLCEMLLRFTASLAEDFSLGDRTVSCAHTTSDLKL